MIGDVSKGAPRRCKLGRHIGQERGGTMVFTCSRCGGDFWQTADMRAVTAAADARIAAGDHSAVSWAADEVARIAGEAKRPA
jgi:hypothetical protein